MSVIIKPHSAYNQDVRTLAKSENKNNDGPMGQKVSALAHAKNTETLPQHMSLIKKQFNASILKSTLEFNETISAKPYTLLLKTALQGINEALNEMGVETSVQETYQSGLDFSPEATAERIVSFSTHFFGAYYEQHTELDEKQALTSFAEIIGGGIDKGFAEARDILKGLKVLDGEIADNIDKTYQLVQDGLLAFIELKTEEE